MMTSQSDDDAASKIPNVVTSQIKRNTQMSGCTKQAVEGGWGGWGGGDGNEGKQKYVHAHCEVRDVILTERHSGDTSS